MSSLCPHVFEEYLKKVSEILETYKPQIFALVQYKDISEGLVKHKVIKKREHGDIIKTLDETQQMAKVLEIIKKRMWGLENFITTLIDGNKDTWLSEELFQAYVRHLVVNMKKLQTQKICDCFHGANHSVLYQSWVRALETFDGYLYHIGTSLGFLTLTMHPANSLLDFIRNRLPIPQKKIITAIEVDLQSSDSSEGESELTPDDAIQGEPNISKLTETAAASSLKPALQPRKINSKQSTQNGTSASAAASFLNSSKTKATQPGASLSMNHPKVPTSSLGPSKKSIISKPPILPRSKVEPSQSRSKDLGNKSNNLKSIISGSSKPSPDFPNPIPVRRPNILNEPMQMPGDALMFDALTQTSSFYSASPIFNKEETDSKANLQDQYYCLSHELQDEKEAANMRGLRSSPESSLSLSDSDLNWDDDIFLPNPSPPLPLYNHNRYVYENAGTRCESSDFSTNIKPKPISRQVNINGSVKTFETPGETVVISKPHSDSEHPIERPPLSPSPRVVQTETRSTQTNLPSEVKECSTQTTPSSPILKRHSISYPGDLAHRPQKIINRDEAAFLLNPNVPNSSAEQNSTEPTNGFSVSSKARVVKPFLGTTATTVSEKKQFSGKNLVVKKISAAMSSVASSLKHSSSTSNKTLSRTMSTSSATNKSLSSKTLPARAASISTIPASNISPKLKSDKLSTQPLPSTSTSTTKSLPVASISSKKLSSSTPGSSSISTPSVKKPSAPKVPTIPLRERVQIELREKKANAPPPPPPINEDRLAPEDYNSLQWSNAWAAKQAQPDLDKLD